MLMTSFLLALAVAADPANGDLPEPVISNCQITSIDSQAVPAADAGVLTKLGVKPGTRVEKGAEIGRIDDTEAAALLRVKQLEYEVANYTAESDIVIRHAAAAADVARAAYLKLDQSNKALKGTITAIDLLKAELEWKKSRLAIEQAKEENSQARLTARAKKAEVGAAQVALDRRILRAPFNGIVTKVVKKQNEWVAPGEAVVQLVGVDRLNIKGVLDAREWNPADIQDRKVTVEVALPRGETMQVPGKITYVSPVAVVNELPVMAEIQTPMRGNQPLVRAGWDASMTIHVNQPPVAAAAAVRRAPPRRAAPVRPTSTSPRAK